MARSVYGHIVLNTGLRALGARVNNVVEYGNALKSITEGL